MSKKMTGGEKAIWSAAFVLYAAEGGDPVEAAAAAFDIVWKARDLDQDWDDPESPERAMLREMVGEDE